MSSTVELPLWPLSAMARRVGVPAEWLRLEAEAGRIPAVSTGKNHSGKKQFSFAPELVEKAIRDMAIVRVVGGEKRSRR